MNECSNLIDEVNQILDCNECSAEITVCTEKETLHCDKNGFGNQLNGDSQSSKGTDSEISENESTPRHGTEHECEKSPIKINTDNVSYKNISVEDNTYLEFNNNERVIELESLVVTQKKKLDDYDIQVRSLEQKCSLAKNVCADMESRVQMAIRQFEMATKEKESMVMRYAVSEKGSLDQRAGREAAERKLQEAMKEKDLLQNKLSAMISEKARICHMLDNKSYELRSVHQELDRSKSDVTALETKLKWSQNSLRTEIELHKESTSKAEQLTTKLQETTSDIEKTKKDAQESINAFHKSQENRAHVLDQKLKEQQASLILEKHEREERENLITNLKTELDRLQNKHQSLIKENNDLSVKVQQLERGRLENEQKLSELRGCADKHRQDEANLNSLSASVDQLKLQLTHEQEQKEANSQQVTCLKQRNSELETDMEACRIREAEMLFFTQQLTDKNVRLQSEFSALETKVQQLTCEQTLLKRSGKEHETRSSMLAEQLEQEKALRVDESQVLARHLAEKTKLSEQLTQQLEDQRGENLVIKRKSEVSVKEVTKELQQCRKRLEQYEKAEASTNSRSSSSSSLNVVDSQIMSSSPSPVNVAHSRPSTESIVSDHQVIKSDNGLDRQVLIDHIVKLQRVSAKKSEKLDFLEEHVQTLLGELQRKSRLLQAYMVREQSGTLSSNRMDDNKAELAKLSGIMASVYGSRVQDNSLTLELSLDINRKLQAVLEDTLLKNITLKENVDTLGVEIDRLNKLKKI